MHLDFYKKNKAYSERLRSSDPRQFQAIPQVCASQAFHKKYARALRASWPSNAVLLDVGSGAGQVVHSLTEAGYDAHGVEVSETNLDVAREGPGHFHLFDGNTLPFGDGTFNSVGAFNVMEHVENPIALLDEMTRVLRSSGRIVLSSPNFFRVLGWRDYHPKMRGVRQKLRNARTLLAHQRIYSKDPKTVLFEKMEPIHREPFQPDDDAIAATCALDFVQYLRSRNYENIRVSCVDRPVPALLEFALDLTPLRYLMFNSFVTANKK